MDTYTSRGRDSVGSAADSPPDVGDEARGPVLRFVDVVKAFGAGQAEVRALNGVSLDFEPGEFVPFLVGAATFVGSAAAQRVRPVRMSTLATD